MCLGVRVCQAVSFTAWGTCTLPLINLKAIKGNVWDSVWAGGMCVLYSRLSAGASSRNLVKSQTSDRNPKQRDRSLAKHLLKPGRVGRTTVPKHLIANDCVCVFLPVCV